MSERTCDYCHGSMEGKRKGARFCQPTHKAAWHRTGPLPKPPDARKRPHVLRHALRFFSVQKRTQKARGGESWH